MRRASTWTSGQPRQERPLRLGIVLSGGPAPGGHNVIAGLYEAARRAHPDSQLIGFLAGPKGIITNKHKYVTREMVQSFDEDGIDLYVPLMIDYAYWFEPSGEPSMASQIEAAELLPERKARLLARKKLQVEKARLTRATACYNAAAGFHNAGEFAIARAMAERAAFHPYFQAKAREFAAFLAEKK